MTTGGKQTQLQQSAKPSISVPKAELTANALIYQQEPTFAEWEKHGQFLQSAQGSSLWWIGDWFVWGEQQFGEQAYQAVSEYSPETVRAAVWVCSRVFLKYRRQSLGFQHHRIVAGMDREQMDKWLAIAEEHALTCRELSASVKAGRIVRQDELDAERQPSGEITDLALVFATPQWQRWRKQQWEERHDLPIEQRKAWLEMLREPAELYEQLKQEIEKE